MNDTKETVILVHGTWAAPQEGSTQWYQLDEKPTAQANFAVKLNRALEERGSRARCWAHSNGAESYSWSGENTWVDRSRASVALAANVTDLQKDGWRCHIVAHSHGGNIVAEALPAMLPSHPSSVVTLGTPFLDAMTPIARRIDRRGRLAAAVAWGSFTFLVALVILVAIFFVLGRFPLTRDWNQVEYLIAAYAIGFIAVEFFVIRKQMHRPDQGWIGYWSALASAKQPRPFLLAIGSAMDEAWQLLHHMRSISNPLAVKEHLLGYLWNGRKANARRYIEIQKIQGVLFFSDLVWHAKIVALVLIFFAVLYICGLMLPITYNKPLLDILRVYATFVAMWLMIASVAALVYGRSFYSAVWSPFRSIGNQLRLIAQTPEQVGTYVVRRRAWHTLQQLAFGLEGYGYSLPSVDRKPGYVPAGCCQYEDLLPASETRAIERRDAWVARNFGEATKTFSNLVVTASDLIALLRTVENDVSLIHAAYYTEDECIARVADWIAGVR